MALQTNLTQLSAEAIDEYIAAADLCIHHRKLDGGCLGYPTVLLLFCTVEALGNYLSPKEPLAVLNDPLFGKSYGVTKVKNIRNWYRNLLAHAAIIAPGICLTLEPEGEPFDFEEDEPVRLRVVPFYRMVRAAWHAFDKERLKPETQLRDKHYRARPHTKESLNVPGGSSSAPFVVKPTKM